MLRRRTVEAEREHGAGKERKIAAWERELYKDVATILDRIEDTVVKVCGLWNAAEERQGGLWGAQAASEYRHGSDWCALLFSPLSAFQVKSTGFLSY